MDEKISVIVPVYNVEQYLRRCVDSLLVQTYRNIEIILIDDCSTDKSAAIIRDYVETHPQLCRCIIFDKNKGASAVRNVGIQEAKGEWIAFVDSDDWVTEEYLSEMYNVAQKDNSDIVMSSINYYYSDGNYKKVSPFGNLTTESTQKEKVALSRAYSPTRLFRKELFEKEKILFPEDIQRGEDIATIIPLLTKTDKISLIDKPMYYYFQRKNSRSNFSGEETDTSFYPEVIHRMMEASNEGFETELEFRAISELMYGMIIIMIRSKKEKAEICRQIDKFNMEYANWRNNPYLPYLARGKRIFVSCAYHKWYGLLKLMVWAWDKKQSF